MRIGAVDGGHNIPFDFGRVEGNLKEFFLNKHIALLVQEGLINKGYTIYDFEGLLSKKIKYIKSLNLDFAIEIHHNGCSNPNKRGAEVIYNPEEENEELLARCILKSIKDNGFPVNGAYKDWWRYDKSSGKKFAYTSKLKIPSPIIECLYETNSKDVEIIQSAGYYSDMAFAIIQGIENYFNSL
jgi:N-acetylmuramoyl-L-alanine amidase